MIRDSFLVRDRAAYEIGFHRGLELKYCFHPNWLTEDLARALDNGTYELQEAQAAQRLVTSEDVVLEIGGGLGLVAAHIGRSCSPAFYCCVEANPFLIGAIHHTLHVNDVRKALVVHGVATNDGRLLKQGWTHFNTWYEFWGSTTEALDGAEPIVVPVVSFDELVKNIRPTILICDIEGGEGELLESTRLDSVRSVVMEIHPEMSTKSARHRILDMLQGRGFTVASSTSNVLSASRSW